MESYEFIYHRLVEDEEGCFYDSNHECVIVKAKSYAQAIERFNGKPSTLGTLLTRAKRI